MHYGLHRNILRIVFAAIVISGCSNNSNQSVSAVTMPPSNSKVMSTATFTLTPTATQTNIPTSTFTSTATFTPTPIPPSPTKTPIPEELSQIPLTFADADTSVAADLVVFQVTDVFGLSSIGDRTVKSSVDQFLTIEAYIYNYSDSPVTVFKSDFKATFINTNSIRINDVEPDVDLMRVLKDERYSDRDWPAQNWRFDRKFIIEPKRSKPIFLVYEVPKEITAFSLQFTPNNVNPPPTLGIWLPKSDNGKYSFFKVSTNNEPIFDFEFLPETVTELLEVVDTRTESLDNCFGSSELERETGLDRTISLEIITTADSGELGKLLNFLPGFQTFTAALGDLIGVHYERTEGEVMTFTDATRLRAAPGKHTEYRVTYYKVNLDGKIRIHIGDETFDVPYSIGDRLRTAVVSLPVIPCETPSP